MNHFSSETFTPHRQQQAGLIKSCQWHTHTINLPHRGFSLVAVDTDGAGSSRWSQNEAVATETIHSAFLRNQFQLLTQHTHTRLRGQEDRGDYMNRGFTSAGHGAALSSGRAASGERHTDMIRTRRPVRTSQEHLCMSVILCRLWWSQIFKLQLIICENSRRGWIIQHEAIFTFTDVSG